VVAVAGEVLTDLVPAGDDGHFQAAFGGSPGNVAVGLARLGVEVRMLARLSGDILGERLRDHLERNGVDLSHTVTAAEHSSLAIVMLKQDGSAAYDFRVDGTADWQWTDDELASSLDGVQALHVGSLAITTPPGGDVLRRLAARATSTATVSFDPNVRHLLMGPREGVLGVVHEMLGVADVVKASSEDTEWLQPGESLGDVARAWLDQGPAMVVLTRGSDGCVCACSASGLVEVPGRNVDVVDTVGAGDSFMSALLAGLARRDLLGAERRDALRGLGRDAIAGVLAEAVEASAITCSRRGSDPPRLDELSLTTSSVDLA
jgi:fructokinase